jgi:hypothetical protein
MLGYTSLHGPALLVLRVLLLFVVLPMVSLFAFKRESEILRLRDYYLLSSKFKSVLPMAAHHRKKVMMNNA